MSDRKDGFKSPIADRKRSAAVASPPSVRFNTPSLDRQGRNVLERKSFPFSSSSSSSSPGTGLFSSAPSNGSSKRRRPDPHPNHSTLINEASSGGATLAPPSATKTDTESIKTPENSNKICRAKRGAKTRTDITTAKKKLSSLINPMSPSHIVKEPNEVCLEIIDEDGCRKGLNSLPREWSVQQLVDSVATKKMCGAEHHLYDHVSRLRIQSSLMLGELDNKISYKICPKEE